MPSTVHHLPLRPRQTLADLMAPDREADEKLLRVIQGFEDRGVEVTFDEPKPIEGHVSEYLTRPLRTEQQARADRAKLHPVFAGIFDAFGLSVKP